MGGETGERERGGRGKGWEGGEQGIGRADIETYSCGQMSQQTLIWGGGAYILQFLSVCHMCLSRLYNDYVLMIGSWSLHTILKCIMRLKWPQASWSSAVDNILSRNDWQNWGAYMAGPRGGGRGRCEAPKEFKRRFAAFSSLQSDRDFVINNWALAATYSPRHLEALTAEFLILAWSCNVVD